MSALPTTILGRTGFDVTRLGLGCGGPSRLGLKQQATRDDAVRVIRAALDMGVNFLDTAEAYTTEPQVAQAVRESGRDDVVVCTKTIMSDYPEHDNRRNAAAFRKQVEKRLVELQTDCLDILLIHGIDRGEYDYAASELAPLLDKMRDEGKLRFFGFSEEFNKHQDHHALCEAAARDDDCWDVVMLAFNVLAQNARDVALPWAMRHNVGVLCMYAVRRVLSDADRLRETIAKLIDEGQLSADAVDRDNPLGFLVHADAATSVTAGCYRFALSEPGIDVVLSGTGNVDHLRANVDAACAGPLNEQAAQRVRSLFGHVSGVSGN